MWKLTPDHSVTVWQKLSFKVNENLFWLELSLSMHVILLEEQRFYLQQWFISMFFKTSLINISFSKPDATNYKLCLIVQCGLIIYVTFKLLFLLQIIIVVSFFLHATKDAFCAFFCHVIQTLLTFRLLNSVLYYVINDNVYGTIIVSCETRFWSVVFNLFLVFQLTKYLLLLKVCWGAVTFWSYLRSAQIDN